jgi:urease accessory protein
MYDGDFQSDRYALQRARGAVSLAFRRRDAATVLARLRQEGALKARFPRPEPGAWTGAVLLNTSGGVAGGDRLEVTVEAETATRVTLATQAAERFYRALPDSRPACVRTCLRIGHGAALEWLPQESIFFDACALDRTLDIHLAVDARFLGVEMLVFGRRAMGEDVRQARLRDRIMIRHGGRTVLHDTIRFDGEVAALLDRPAVAGGARALATLIAVLPGLDPDALRVALAVAGVEAGASAWDGILVARMVARDSACLRAALVAGLAVLRRGRPLPRIWLC